MKNILIILFFIFAIPVTVSAETVTPYLVTEGFEQNVSGSIRTYFTKNIPLEYKSGKVVLSLSPDGTGEALVGESIDISVSYPGNGTFERINTSFDCSTNNKMGPLDISHLLHTGLNNVQVRYRRVCFPGIKKADALYLVHFDDFEPTAEPFLDLPWDYVGKGQRFEDAALNIESYFDHQYPLLSTNIEEPAEFTASITNFLGKTIDRPYSNHDGYDFAFNSNVKLNDPVLAAASGNAIYVNTCAACGNAIHIDHGNGYQTRYYHLQPEGLITNNPTQSIQVTNRQQIGRVGFSGNIRPSGEKGAHLHFMIVKDKNSDGNFEDNIPDGLVDPYGWQSNLPDPWAIYSFELFNETKTGTKSHYMWKHKVPGLQTTLHPQGGTHGANRHVITFPNGFTTQDLILTVQSIGVSTSDANILPIGPGIDITLWDGIDSFITEFQKQFTLVYDFSNLDISRINKENVFIYSSIDGINWEKESTTIDWENLKATMQANHLTQFALFAEKLDSIAPVTTSILSGTEASGKNQYKFPVLLSFIANDEPQEKSSEIQYTFYKINGTEWNIYQDPILFTKPAHYKVEYYSQDNDGNSEKIKTLEFTIVDDILPELRISFNFDKNVFEVLPTQENVSINTEVIKKKKKESMVYTVTSDNVTTAITTQMKGNNNKYVLKIISYNYNNSIIPVEKEKLSVEYIHQNAKKGNKIKQVYHISDTIKVVLQYFEKDDVTKIIHIENGREEVIDTIKGFRKIVLETNKGTLQYSIH